MAWFKRQNIVIKIIIGLIALGFVCCVCSIPIAIISPDRTPTAETVTKVEETKLEQPSQAERTESVSTNTSESSLTSGVTPTPPPPMDTPTTVPPTETSLPTPTSTPLPPTDTPTTASPTETPLPTSTPPPPTETPIPTATPIPPTPTPEGKLVVGTHLIGSGAEPGIYVGYGDGLLGCYWERLSGLSGEFEDIISNDNSEGLFYLEILPSDVAIGTDCLLTPIDQVPARAEFLTTLPPGMYLVGRDIAPGLYTGVGTGDFGCYWERLNGVSGTFENIISNDIATGQFFVEVQSGDMALSVDCEVEKAK